MVRHCQARREGGQVGSLPWGPRTQGGPGVEDVMIFFCLILGGKLDVGGRDKLFFWSSLDLGRKI